MGICGGYQMLGKKIYDSYALESKRKEIKGLDLLPLVTSLAKNKVLSHVKAQDIFSGQEVVGYEIHHGSSKYTGIYQPLFRVIERNSKMTEQYDGIRAKDGRVLGTYIHGLFDSDTFRRNFLNQIRRRLGWRILKTKQIFSLDREFDKLAKALRKNLDLESLYKILRKGI
jgi:adenosylcobyric acid synthase